jgi:predicted HTH domain antitoxin
MVAVRKMPLSWRQLTTRVPPKIHKIIDDLAHEQGITIAEYLRQFLIELFEQKALEKQENDSLAKLSEFFRLTQLMEKEETQTDAKDQTTSLTSLIEFLKTQIKN